MIIEAATGYSFTHVQIRCPLGPNFNTSEAIGNFLMYTYLRGKLGPSRRRIIHTQLFQSNLTHWIRPIDLSIRFKHLPQRPVNQLLDICLEDLLV